MRGLGIRMLTLDTTSLYAEDRGIQVPMVLEHDKIPLTVPRGVGVDVDSLVFIHLIPRIHHKYVW